jgi:hypothetical protein
MERKSIGHKQVEAALIPDDALRFGKSVNPMPQRLSDAWHPERIERNCGIGDKPIISR